MAILSVDDLAIEFSTPAGRVSAVKGIGFEVEAGSTVAIVGESGSGKSVTALSILRLIGKSGKVTSGSITFDGRDLLKLDSKAMRNVRGRSISMVFQNPLEALNPIRRVGDQISDVLQKHMRLTRREARARAIDLLAEVRISDPENRLDAYPFELSGGMCQRVMIAIAIACTPKLLIADEPTTGLDVTTQKVIMEMMRDLCRARRMSTILITHDLALASQYADRLIVMQQGCIVEAGNTADLLRNPSHDYTKRLLAATPRPGITVQELLPPHERQAYSTEATCPIELEPACPPLLEVRNLSKVFSSSARKQAAAIKAVDDVSFEIRAGECVGLVGESGSGKTTVSRIIARLANATDGEVRFQNQSILHLPTSRFSHSPLRSRIQYVFQDPSSSLNPRWTALDSIADPLRQDGRFRTRREILDRVAVLARRVGLPENLLARFPHQLSGGQKARVGLARAIALDPKLVILDEPTTALDVSIQAVVLNQLTKLRTELGLSFLFISHDLTVVSFLCDRLVILKAGRVVESGPTESIFEAPKTDYVKELLSAIPRFG